MLKRTIWFFWIFLKCQGYQTQDPFDECLASAEHEINKAPDKSEMFVTTSRLYKWHLARYFCKLPIRTVVLELGVYHGHSTAVLAAIFQQVIAVDINEAYLKIAARNDRNHSNIAFLAVDLMAAGWQMFASSGVQAVVVDADHRYEHVRQDAYNALSYLRELEYLIFDDFGHEVGVQRTVRELRREGALVDCHPIGNGWNGSWWEYQNWNEQTGQKFISWTNESEGLICRRGNFSASGLAPGFVDQRFYVYKQPLQHLCPTSILRLLPGHRLVTSFWGDGTWRKANDGRDALLLELQGLSDTPVELLFNSARSAFVLSQLGKARTDWFGIRDNIVFEPFQRATRQFDE